MNLISGRNAHEILPRALDLLFKRGVQRPTRNGDVLQLSGPTLIHYEKPLERVIFWPERDANPFFHLMESLWMLTGRNDVAFPAGYAKQIANYSDDGITLNGAYGYRWRKHWNYDQLDWIVDELKANPNCRRQVLSMWDAGSTGEDYTGTGDPYLAGHGSKDVPCNTHAYFAINERGALDLTVCNRSNDLVWGALGANAVHFSVLLEYMAARIGVAVGSYYQFTNNLHGYLATAEPLRDLVARQGEASPYELDEVWPTRLIPVGEEQAFEEDLANLDGCIFYSSFFNGTVEPVMEAFAKRSLDAARRIEAPDWRKACTEWLQRREAKKQRAQDDGVSYE